MRNNKLKEIKQFVKTICESNDNYEDIEKCMKQYFTMITDSASPRVKEFNKKYNVITLANSKSRQDFIQTLANGDKLIVDHCFYNNNKNDILVIFSVMENWEDNWLQKDIGIFVKEN